MKRKQGMQFKKNTKQKCFHIGKFIEIFAFNFTGTAYLENKK